MRGALIAFAAGVLAAHAHPIAQVAATVLGAACAVLLLVRGCRVPAAFGLGCAWTALATGGEQVDVGAVCPGAATLAVAIVGLPVREDLSTRFEGRVLAPARCGLAPGDRLRLAWTQPDAPLPRPGQVWRVEAKLDRARAHVNPHGFDYERWLVGHGVVASGYVIAARLQADRRDPVDDYRLRLRERVESLGLVHRGAILALATGDTALVSQDVWQWFRATGTVHLLVISGLHVGLFAALGMGVGNALGRLLPSTRRWRARALGGGVALAAVVAYATAAGWTLSVTRAALMACMGVVVATAGRRVAASDGLALALAVVLAMDPLAALATGFWLSFAAVGVLIAFFAPRTQRGRPPPMAGAAPRRWPAVLATVRYRMGEVVTAQLVVAVAFAPFLGIFVGQVHPLAPLVNLVLIPVVGLVGAPCSVLGVLTLPVVPGLAEPLLAIADRTLAGVFRVVEWAATVGSVPAGFGVSAVSAALLLSLAFLLPWSRWSRCVVAVGVLAAVSRVDPGPRTGFDVTVLDVGQGTSVLVRTRHQSLLYDTGPRYPSGFDVGAAVVAPHVLRVHAGAVTELVLSHADIDHVGGAGAVGRLLAVRGTSAGEPVAGLDARPCRAGHGWLWDGVRFRVLSPRPGRSGNDASCVIEVDDGDQRALLAGDIERLAERAAPVRRAALLVVPHHGSRTSSTDSLVSRVCPRFAVVSAGYRNRFGHPHPEVVERYRRVGAHVVTTGALGAVLWRSSAPGAVEVGRDDWRHWRTDARPGFANRATASPATWAAPCAPAGAARSGRGGPGVLVPGGGAGGAL